MAEDSVKYIACDLFDPATPFKYDRLDSNAGEIRLAVLLEGVESEEIMCWITHTTLESAKSYEALSYVWGSSEDMRSIKLVDRNGLWNHSFSVTRNLEEALRVLRLETHRRTFWIDAICINQEDDVERSAQVAMMRSIYSSASATIVYFGPEDEFSSRGMELIKRIATEIKIDLLPEVDFPHKPRKVENHPVRIILEELDGIETVHQLFSRPWWSRVWIAQELLVSKTAVLQWGKRALYWEYCGRTIAALSNYMSHLRDTPEWNETEIWSRIDNFKFWTIALMQTPNDFYHVDRPLAILLQRFWLSEASNPRDKVYALLGIATDDHPDSLKPDYSLDAGQVYGMVVKDVMNRSKNLDILSLCSGTGTRRVEGLPTWAPNWRSQGKKSKMEPLYHTFTLRDINTKPGFYGGRDTASEVRPQFCASGESNSLDTVRFSKDFRELFLTGLKAGVISQLSEVRSYDFSLEEISRDWGVIGDTLTGRYRAGGPVAAAFGRTLCANQFDFDIYSIAANLYGWRGCVNVVTAGRRFMLTDYGFMGLAVAEAEIGDIVCVCRGSRVPVILRVENDHFTMVGEAYVHGIMYGEGYNWGDISGSEVEFRIL